MNELSAPTSSSSASLSHRAARRPAVAQPPRTPPWPPPHGRGDRGACRSSTTPRREPSAPPLSTGAYTIKVQNVQKVSTTARSSSSPADELAVRRPQWQPRRLRRQHHQGVREGQRADVRDERGQERPCPAALAFLMGKGSLVRDFTMRLLDPAQMKFEGGYVLEEHPQGRDARVPKDAPLRRRPRPTRSAALLVLKPPGLGTASTETPVVNVPVAKGEFDFIPPPGTRSSASRSRPAGASGACRRGAW